MPRLSGGARGTLPDASLRPRQPFDDLRFVQAPRRRENGELPQYASAESFPSENVHGHLGKPGGTNKRTPLGQSRESVVIRQEVEAEYT